MSTLIRKLGSGETMVFSKETRDIFLVKKGHAAEDLEAAKKLHADGAALKLSKTQLETINSALAHIVLLGA